MKFDTRDKKPKVYNILIISVIAAIITAVLVIAGGEDNVLIAAIIAAAYFLVVIIILVISFIHQLQYNPYSYNSIIYIGFAFFILYLLIVQIVLCVKMFSNPEMASFNQIYYLLLNSAKNYMLLTSLFLVVFSIGLCISNISLIKHEGFRFHNILGIVLAVILVGGAICIFAYDSAFLDNKDSTIVHNLIANFFATVYLYFECMIAGVIVAMVIVAKHEPEKNKDFIIILGCSLLNDGSPTPLLKGRIERAIAFYRAQLEETNKELFFITSGGKGSDERISESAAMKGYLLEQGIPERLVIEEDISRNTFENMKFSKEKIFDLNPDARVAFSTTNFHVFRSGIYARRNKMKAIGVGAFTKWYFWPNASVREFISLITAHRGKQILILIVMIAVYAALTYLVSA